MWIRAEQKCHIFLYESSEGAKQDGSYLAFSVDSLDGIRGSRAGME